MSNTTPAPTDALLPCPFCGGAPNHGKTMDEDIWSHNTVAWRRVRCSECEIGTDYVCEGYEPSEVAAWNRRAQPAASPAPVVSRYRLLERGRDKIQAGDEFLREDGVTWRTDPSGIFVGCTYEGNILLPARRAIEATPSRELPDLTALTEHGKEAWKGVDPQKLRETGAL